MKKTILFLITLITLTNISYASFPVIEGSYTEVVETIESTSYNENTLPILGILSLIFSIVGLILLSTSAILSAPMVFAMSIISGVVGLFHRRSRRLSITGIILSVITIVIFLHQN
tara:strand:+ start:115 stop:459 length:345 start_codon:yes stop_codon:yes gene_type:complete